MTGQGRSALRAALGTAVFVLLVPGTVVGLLPGFLSGWRLAPPFLGWPPVRWIGAGLIVAAAPVFLAFVMRFVGEGRGTPAPVAPPEKLVVGGPFRYTRNPGYVAVVAMIVGQALVYGQVRILVYALVLAVGFHLFVVLYEEPTLRRQFGADYDAYCRRVPRWLPRRPGGG
jgi:protein-S-isoprenylcysteine O-methyltransferase Ste14